MQVSDLMSTHVVTIPPECTAADAAALMVRRDTGFVPVCGERGNILGILTDRDLVSRCIAQRLDPERAEARELMTRNVVSVSPEEDVKTAADIMSGEQLRRLPVVDGGRLVGVISLADLVHSELYDMEAAHALTEITDAPRMY